jgi:DNA-binding LacI/PurR family transcriptional regulator
MQAEFASSSPTSDGVVLRAGERVLQFLASELARSTLNGGEERLPTNKELAIRLNVSPGTVQAMLRKVAKEGRIRSRRGSGTYLVAPSDQPAKTIRIGIGASLQKLHDPDGWTSRIGGGIFEAALTEQVLLEGISNAEACPEAMVEELMEKKAKLDALILLPYSAGVRHTKLIEAYESVGKPVVHIHPPSMTSTANFTSTGFLGAGRAVAQAWKKTGRKRILFFLTVIHGGEQRSTIPDQLRYAGLISGLGPQNGTILSTCESINHESTQEAGYRKMKQLIARGGGIPDAVYCSGDWLALGALQAFRESGIRVPEDVSIVGAGGMNLSQTICPDLTRARNNLELVGAEAVKMVARRIQLGGISLPGVIVPASFMGGATTRREENLLLEIAAPATPSRKDQQATAR